MAIPRFNKAADDRFASSDWSLSTSPVQLVLLEGYSNEVLSREFQPLYALVDQWVMLCAPSFDSVFNWRQEQERKLAASIVSDWGSRLMDDNALQNFVQHFERLTRSCLDELPGRVHHLLRLGENRQVTAYTHRPNTNKP